MKRTETRKLVLTDGTWYYMTSTVGKSLFTNNPKKAWNFYVDSAVNPEANGKRHLQWVLDYNTKDEPLLVADIENGYCVDKSASDFKRERCKLKWLTIIETIEEEEFNYEGFK